jgi:hypothetical protein
MIAFMAPQAQETSPFNGQHFINHGESTPRFSTWNGINTVQTTEASPYEQVLPSQQKRFRDDKAQVQEINCHQREHYVSHSIPETQSEEEVSQSSAGKRSRHNDYRPPREIKTSVVSVMGSLVGGGFVQSNTQVKIRRQLSGSHLDQFFTSDAMDEDVPEHRERSMSF